MKDASRPCLGLPTICRASSQAIAEREHSDIDGIVMFSENSLDAEGVFGQNLEK